MARGSKTIYHGMTGANRTRPKSPLYKRRNKAKARVRREARLAAKKH